MISKPLILDAAENIWRGYTYKCDMSFRTRNGLIATGTVNPLELADPYSRPEFTAEHEGRSAFLLSMLYSWYPLITKGSFRRVRFMLMHDGGERINGDMLDDGSKAHEEARVAEERAMDELISCFPKECHRELKSQYADFENYCGSMAFPKAVDKAEAVLWQIYLYKHGRIGYVSWKKPPSGRDLRFGEILKTYRAMDVWCLHYRVATQRVERHELIDAVLTEAFKKVCGSLPLCMTIDVSGIPLDLPDDNVGKYNLYNFPEEILQPGIA